MEYLFFWEIFLTNRFPDIKNGALLLWRGSDFGEGSMTRTEPSVSAHNGFTIERHRLQQEGVSTQTQNNEITNTQEVVVA